MIFDAKKLLKTSENSGLMMEELLLLQTIYDYQVSMKILDKETIEELNYLYNNYFSKFNKKYDEGGEYEIEIPWSNIVNKLIRDGWLIDHRMSDYFNLGELEISDKFKDIFKGKQSDRELYELVKDIFPKMYINNYDGKRLFNFKGNEQEDLAVFKVFQTKVLTGNRAEKFNEFYKITYSLFEEGSEVSPMRWDRYVASFYDNLKLYKEQVQLY